MNHEPSLSTRLFSNAGLSAMGNGSLRYCGTLVHSHHPCDGQQTTAPAETEANDERQYEGRHIESISMELSFLPLLSHGHAGLHQHMLDPISGISKMHGLPTIASDMLYVLLGFGPRGAKLTKHGCENLERTFMRYLLQGFIQDALQKNLRNLVL